MKHWSVPAAFKVVAAIALWQQREPQIPSVHASDPLGGSSTHLHDIAVKMTHDPSGHTREQRRLTQPQRGHYRKLKGSNKNTSGGMGGGGGGGMKDGSAGAKGAVGGSTGGAVKKDGRMKEPAAAPAAKATITTITELAAANRGKDKVRGGSNGSVRASPSDQPSATVVPVTKSSKGKGKGKGNKKAKGSKNAKNSKNVKNSKKVKSSKQSGSPVFECIPSSGVCVTTSEALELEAATPGAVVAICAGTTIATDTAIVIEQDEITLCCEGNDAVQCVIQSSGNDNNLDAFGDSIQLRDITFEDGVGEVVFGGNVAIDGNGDHFISGVVFRGGKAAQVGGNLFVQTQGTVTVEDSFFLNGQAGEAGGGMYVLNARAVSVRDTIFQSNSGGQTGGGFFSILSPAANTTGVSQTLVFDSVDFIGNTARIGGGFFLTDLGQNPTITIVDTDFSANAANQAGGGGAIAQFLDAIDLTISDSRGINNQSPICPDILAFFSFSQDPFCIDANTDFPAGSTDQPVPTAPTAPIVPTVPTAPTAATSSPSPSPVPSPGTAPPSPECIPTAGTCVSTAVDLATQANVANAVVALCAPSIITTDSAIAIAESSVTVCCAAADLTQCVLQSSGTDSILSVTGSSITLRDLSFLDGQGNITTGGNVAIRGNGDHVISNCAFVNGVASEAGGNLFVDTNGSILLDGSLVANGRSGRNGGGMFVQNAQTVTLRNSLFQSNTAAGGTGGGFFSVVVNPSDPGQQVTIENTDFTSNSAAIGGGFFVTQLGTLPTLSILNSDFSSNVGTDAAGAGALAVSLNQLKLVIVGGSGTGNQAPICPDILGFFDNSTQPFCVTADDVRFPP